MSVTDNTNPFPKTPTGVSGLDEITDGGFPTGRPILICGGPGCGKTLMSTQFLVNGIMEYNEPGVFVSFEETVHDLKQNVRSLGFDLDKLIADKMLRVDHVRVDATEIEETGEYDLEGLFVRLNYAIDTIGAKRVVLDTIESLFGGLSNTAILRSEIRRLFHWLKEKGVTAVITGEKGEATLTRQGLEEYVSDCVLFLDFRIIDQIATRRMRVVKYRGSTHGTNEYPFLIDNQGISVMPITSMTLEYESSDNVISLGLPELDKMFSRGGIFEGASTLVTGIAGTAKTILASYFALGSCLRNESVLYFSFEESPGQLIRNLRSINLDLEPYVESGLMQVIATRPSLHGLEMHLLTLFKLLKEHNPKTVIIDPISSLVTIGSISEVRTMLVRLMHTLKTNRVNTLFTALTQIHSSSYDLTSTSEISSLSDTWINLQNEEKGNKMVRSLRIVKTRGMGHVNNSECFRITNTGFEFINKAAENKHV